MPATIPIRSSSDSPEELTKLLDEAGCLVVTGAMDDAARETVRAELAPHLAKTPVSDDDPDAFYPGATRRITALVARSPGVGELVLHPTSTGLCEHHLGANCERFHLHVTAALTVGPGARAQILHREEDSFDFFPVPRPNLVLASMWALTDFRADNGGTLIVPGSHRWEAGREAKPEEIAAAEMPAGSVLYWLGGTLHGAGANVSQDWREGVILTYSLGWLRQEENQYLDVPPRVAEKLSPELRERTGHVMHGSLGFFDGRVESETAGD